MGGVNGLFSEDSKLTIEALVELKQAVDENKAAVLEVKAALLEAITELQEIKAILAAQ